MNILSTSRLKAECFDNGSFELLLEREINVRDRDNKTALMCLC